MAVETELEVALALRDEVDVALEAGVATCTMTDDASELG